MNQSEPGAPLSAAQTFREPWEAQAFALAVALHAKGLFNWPEWAAALAVEIAAAGSDDSGEDYYRHWLCALEKLVVAKGAASAQSLDEARCAWDRAARATPHGKPIELSVA